MKKYASESEAAPFRLAEVYESGLITPRDKVLAYAYYNAAGSNNEAARRRDQLAKSMTESDLDRAQKLTRQVVGGRDLANKLSRKFEFDRMVARAKAGGKSGCKAEEADPSRLFADGVGVKADSGPATISSEIDEIERSGNFTRLNNIRQSRGTDLPPGITRSMICNGTKI